jgi:hippurate hydrolase
MTDARDRQTAIASASPENTMLHSDPIAALTPEVIGWRRHIHAYPDLGFNEHSTARFVAEHLRSFGLEVHEGIGGTGVVGVLRSGSGSGAIAIRAELDALPVVERSCLSDASRNNGVMQACGHDGHTAMGLGAAQLLSRSPRLALSISFSNQPRRTKAGACDDRGRPVQALSHRGDVRRTQPAWGAFGTIAVRMGPMMAAVDNFELSFERSGAHAAIIEATIPSSQLAALLGLFNALSAGPLMTAHSARG